MKIAVFHNLPPGGAKRTLYEEVKWLSKKYVVDVYEFSYRENDFFNLKTLSQNVFKYDFEIKSQLPGFLNRLERDFKNFVLLPLTHQVIAKEIDRRNYDVALIHPDVYTESPFILRYIKTPHIYYCHELLRIAYEDIYAFREKVNIFKKLYENTTRIIRKQIDFTNARSATAIITSSKFIGEKVKCVYHKKYHLCYPGVDIKTFKPIGKKRKQILFIGNKLLSEGYDLLIDGIKRLPIKDRPYINLLSFKSNKIKIENDEILAKTYSESLVTLCLDHEEPFGLKAIESMACGTPVLAVNEGGYKESVIEGITGYLINRDPKELSEKLLDLSLNHKKVILMGRNGVEEVKKKWQWSNHNLVVEQLLKKYSRK